MVARASENLDTVFRVLRTTTDAYLPFVQEAIRAKALRIVVSIQGGLIQVIGHKLLKSRGAGFGVEGLGSKEGRSIGSTTRLRG